MTNTKTIADTTEELFEDIDFMEQPGANSTGTPWGWLLAGAAVGIGALYLSHPRHGERRRTEMKEGCRNCGTSLKSQAREWMDRMTRKATDFQAEIRSNAPPYLQ